MYHDEEVDSPRKGRMVNYAEQLLPAPWALLTASLHVEASMQLKDKKNQA